MKRYMKVIATSPFQTFQRSRSLRRGADGTDLGEHARNGINGILKLKRNKLQFGTSKEQKRIQKDVKSKLDVTH